MKTSFSSLLCCSVIQRASGPDTANSTAHCHKIKHDSFRTSFIEHMNKHRHVQHDLPLRLQEVQHPFIQAWPAILHYPVPTARCVGGKGCCQLYEYLSRQYGPRQLSRYSHSLRAGRSGDRIPVGARFSATVQTGPEAHPASYTLGTGSFPGVKRPGRGVDHPPTSSAEVKERVQLYLYSGLFF